MSVVSCTLVGPSSLQTALENKDTYTLEYQVKCNSRSDFATTVLAEARTSEPNPLPAEYQVLAQDNSAYCLGVNLQQQEEREEWKATVTFGPLPQNKTPEDGVTNPLLRPPKIWTELIEELEPVGEYYDGTTKKVLRNGAGQEFIDPVMQERSYPVLVIQQNIASAQQIIDWNLEYEASVNEQTFQGGAPRTVRFLPIQSGQLLYENEVAYYSAVFRFAYKHDTWDRRIVNQGFHYRDAQGKLTRAKDEDGNDMVEPVLLLADGTKAPVDALGVPTNPEDSILVRNTRPLKDYLNLFPEE